MPGADVLALLAGDVRRRWSRALDGVIAAGYRTACLTNNVVRRDDEAEDRPEVAAVMAKFDVVVESSKVGIRKPELGFYTRPCELLGVEPAACVFLDDLGINLKPAKRDGHDHDQGRRAGPAIAELEDVLGIPLSLTRRQTDASGEELDDGALTTSGRSRWRKWPVP